MNKYGPVTLAALLSFLASAAMAQSNFESAKLLPGVVVEGGAVQSPKLSPGVVVQNNAVQSSKLAPGVVVENNAFQSSKMGIGIVLEVLPNTGGTIMRAPLTHW